ncbi:MAG: tetratricopeptide repeat protein [Alphaproteobacteria bacterium]|nr:tetratricopeptide repeat protein [Alphaproteobacteria bacterium]
MIAALLLSGALAAQAGDPYAVLSEDAASVCRQGDAAVSEGRTKEAVSLLGTCNQVIIADQGLSASDRYPLQAHVARRIATAHAQAGDHDAAASYARFAERFEQMAARAPDLDRIAEAEAAYEAGDYPAAEDIWLVLLAEAEAGENLTGSVHERLYQLGRTLLPQGRADEARALLERAMLAMADAEGAPDPRYLTALAEAYFDQGRYEDSAAILRPLYESATGIARSTYGNNLARALDGAGRYTEAETLLRARVAEARARDGQPFASPHALARVLFNLARNLAAQGQAAEAGALFAESAALTAERRPQGHTDIIAAHSFLVRHRLLAEADAPGALAASRTLSANLNAYLSGSAGDIDRNQPIQNAGAPPALFTLHVEAAWSVAAGGQR